MRESDTYQAILDEGRLEVAREVVLVQGCLKFGEPDAGVERVLSRVRSLNRLRRMCDRLLFVGSWQELLQTR